MEIISTPDRMGLRDFAVLMGGMIAALFGLVLPWVFGRHYPLWPWPVAAMLCAWGFMAPASLAPFYRGWMRLGLVLNRITTPLILGLIYLVAIVPCGLIMRMARHDPLARRFDATAASYRVASQATHANDLENPF